MRFSKEEEQYIINDYLQGLNTVEIANKWNTYNTSIRRVLLRNNITPRSIKEALSSIKENPFSSGGEQAEYFLGLLLTDGNIHHRKDCNSVITSLSLKDKEMVEEFRNFINPKGKVSTILHKKSNSYTYSYSIRNDEIAKWLESKGNFVQKSYDCDIYVPLTSHILRGIFDGDGYWHTTNHGHTMSCGICGKSYIFLNKIKDFLQEYNISASLTKRTREGNKFLYYLEVYKTVDVLKFANLIYSGAHIFLIRKYDKWHLFEETLREKFSKFKEGEAPLNPEPSHGRFIMEGAETIMELLNL